MLITIFFSTHVQALRLCTARTAHRGSRGIALSFHDHGARRGWGVSVMPRTLFTPGKDPIYIVQKTGWVPGPVWTGAENLASTGFRSPDRPARSTVAIPTELPGPHWWLVDILIKNCRKIAVTFVLKRRKFVFEQRFCGHLAFRLLTSLEDDGFIHRKFGLQNCWQMTHYTKPRRPSNLLAGDEKKFHCARYIVYLHTHCLIVH